MKRDGNQQQVFSKMIIIHFLKVQNKWVILNNDCFQKQLFTKTMVSFLEKNDHFENDPLVLNF